MAKRQPLGADHEALLRRLDRLTGLLDDRYVIPGLGVRVGLDPLIGLVPVFGDLLTGGVSIYILLQARRFGLPRHVQARMLANIGLDVVIGSIPVVGDLFDVAFKSNRRNIRLLQKQLARRARKR